MPLDLTDEERAALTRLLEADPHEAADSARAVVVSAKRRRVNGADGAVAIRVSIRSGYSWRQLSAETGYAVSTLRDWARTPPATDEGDEQ